MTNGGPGGVEGQSASFVRDVLDEELDSLRLLVGEGQLAYALRSLDERGRAQELVRQQYSGRYPFELLQNANDTMMEGAGQRVAFVVTPDALLVANTGRGFGQAEVRALCSLGRSSKDPRKSVGYKGLGFKSVGEITDAPQVYSPPYGFGFDARRVNAEVSALVGAGPPPDQRLPVYAFPFPLDIGDAGTDSHLVEGLLDEGFVSVLRLPLRPTVSAADVLKQVRELLVPELLLFLPNIDTLEVRHGQQMVRTRSATTTGVDYDDVTIEHNRSTARWLVFRGRRPVNRPLVEPLGDGWRQVQEVGIGTAVKLDGDGRPAWTAPRPLHVYFPLQDSAGLALLLQADFVLDLDRRHVADTPEARPYNDWLRGELIQFLATTVAPQLSALWPADAAAVSILAPRGPAVGFGVKIRAAYDAAMAASPFVPCLDGRLRTPAETILQPPDIVDPGNVARFCDVARLNHLAVDGWTVEALHWLRADLRTSSLQPGDVIALLRDPADHSAAFYTWLVAWADGLRRLRRAEFARLLAEQRCVRTTGGDWVSPSSGVFFPRERAGPSLNVDGAVAIADLPSVAGLHDLLAEAGVQPFRWREILLRHVLPWLADRDTDASLRSDAHRALRAYLNSDDHNDQEILRAVGDTLLPARNRDATRWEWQPARLTYFPTAWSSTDVLETLYGPLDQCEFLAEPPPADPDDRAVDLVYYRRLGVGEWPRADRADGDRSPRFRLPALAEHPHTGIGPPWDDWLNSEPVRRATNCGEHHPGSQQLAVSWTMDRLAELVDSRDPVRLLALALVIGQRWAHYQAAMTATVSCTHQAHHGERARQVPSLLRHILTSAAWIAASQAGSPTLAAPRDVWRDAPDVPRTVARQLMVLDPQLESTTMAPLWAELEVVDSARPDAMALARLLRDLAGRNAPAGTSTARAVFDAARWAMRHLNDALPHSGVDRAALGSVPLLTTHAGQYVFAAKPYVTDNRLLATIWSDVTPILAADSGLAALTTTLGLPRLSDHVTVGTEATDGDPAVSAVLTDALVEAVPYLEAVAMATAPSRRDRITSGLRRIQVVACTQLSLVSTLDGATRAHPITAHVTRTSSGSARRTTVYLQATETADADWFALGPLLAEFLGVDSQGDAFSLLLHSDRPQRDAYLRSRQIDLTPETDQDPEPESDDAAIVAVSAEPVDVQSQGPSGPQPTPTPDPPDLDPAPVTASTRDTEPLPPLDHSTLRMKEPQPTNVPAVTSSTAQPSGTSGGLARSPDWQHLADIARQYGHRGEVFAYHQEQLRLHDKGFDPSRVQWISRANEMADHDLESVDDDGETIYIEVKSTRAAEPGTPFEISASELALAQRHRHRYFIYHVLDVTSTQPHIQRYRDPIRLISQGLGRLDYTRAMMRLSGDSPKPDP